MRSSGGYPKVVKNGSVTVRVYRLSHSTTASGYVYAVSWISQNGRKLAQFAHEEAALAEARLKATQLAAGRVEGAEMSRGDRDELQAARSLAGTTPILAALEEWKRAREIAGENLITAAKAWASRGGDTFEKIDVKTAAERFVAAKSAAGIDIAASYNRILPSFVASLGERLLHTLTSRDLSAWIHERYTHPVSRNTARRRLVTLWRWARKQGYLLRDAVTEAEQTEAAREEAGPIGVIDHGTFAALLDFFSNKHPEYLAPLVVAGFCGLRRAEVHSQKWEDISIERRFLRVSKAKRNTPAHRLVPLPDAAVAWLALCRSRTGPLCQNLAMDRIRHIGRDYSFVLPENCFRHSFISHRVAQTGNVAETALEAGNSPDIIFRHYRELFTKEEGAAWFGILPKSSKVKGRVRSSGRVSAS